MGRIDFLSKALIVECQYFKWLVIFNALWFTIDLYSQSASKVVKVQDIVLYQDSMLYCAFPSITRTIMGELLLAFRSAPDRRIYGETSTSHVDPNSYLVTIRSKDGINWKGQPKLLLAHPYGGVQDPNLLRLRNGEILCASSGWTFVREEGLSNLKKPYSENKAGSIFMGGFTVKSNNHGDSWTNACFTPKISPELRYNALGEPVSAYNTGSLHQGVDGKIFWAVKVNGPEATQSSLHLLTSEDDGKTWDYSCPIALDETVSFDASSTYITPKGNVVVFIRTLNFNGQAAIARSTNNGKSFESWEGMGFKGHPLHALRLHDNRVLLTYGYRYEPYGIRCRILNPECTDFKTAPEFIIRDDGDNTDLGYPWSVQLDDSDVLTVYYFNKNDGPRYIAGSILKIN